MFGRLVCLPDLSSECQLYYQVNLQCMWLIKNLNPFPLRLAKTAPFVILLCETPDDFTLSDTRRLYSSRQSLGGETTLSWEWNDFELGSKRLRAKWLGGETTAIPSRWESVNWPICSFSFRTYPFLPKLPNFTCQWEASKWEWHIVNSLTIFNVMQASKVFFFLGSPHFETVIRIYSIMCQYPLSNLAMWESSLIWIHISSEGLLKSKKLCLLWC